MEHHGDDRQRRRSVSKPPHAYHNHMKMRNDNLWSDTHVNTTSGPQQKTKQAEFYTRECSDSRSRSNRETSLNRQGDSNECPSVVEAHFRMHSRNDQFAEGDLNAVTGMPTAGFLSSVVDTDNNNSNNNSNREQSSSINRHRRRHSEDSSIYSRPGSATNNISADLKRFSNAVFDNVKMGLRQLMIDPFSLNQSQKSKSSLSLITSSDGSSLRKASYKPHFRHSMQPELFLVNNFNDRQRDTARVVGVKERKSDQYLQVVRGNREDFNKDEKGPSSNGNKASQWSSDRPFSDIKLFNFGPADALSPVRQRSLSPTNTQQSQNTAQLSDDDSLQHNSEEDTRSKDNLNNQRNTRDLQYPVHGQDVAIFDKFLVSSLSLKDKESNILIPRIIYASCDSNDAQLANIPLFCFPEWSNATKDGQLTVETFVNDEFGLTEGVASKSQETFSFVLTDIQQNKQFGYCRRIYTSEYVESEMQVKIPSTKQSKAHSKQSKSLDGASYQNEISSTIIKRRKKLPIVFCIISSVGSFQFYKDLLDHVQLLYNDSQLDTGGLDTLFAGLSAAKIPKPGRFLRIQFQGSLLEIQRPVDVATEHVSLQSLFEALRLKSAQSFATAAPNTPFAVLITLITALLLERRIIFVSQSLQKLSDCCNAAISLIYPLDWQHIFIPILPRKLLDFLCSPTPYVIGILTADVDRVVQGWKKAGVTSGVYYHSQNVGNGNFRLTESVDLLPIEEALVINLDSGQILRHDTAESDRGALPAYFVYKLKEYLSKAFDSQSNSSNLSNSVRFRSSADDLKLFRTSTALSSKSKQFSDTQDGVIALALMKMYILILGPYRDCMDVNVAQNDCNTLQKIVQVRFNDQSFVRRHPLLSSNHNNWLSEVLQQGDHPSGTQKMNVRHFLQRLSNSHNFRYFIQQREDAFQYHYQTQLDSKKNNMGTPKLNVDSKLASESGIKNYHALAQSRFEKKVTQLELQYRQKQNDYMDE
ncbi:hypothetical protein MIR68_007742 [Amoeboaphelidium protococcarum]|nr:hypothetical protein MIR68_007742 [Amoeboaphelidium protococcarum]